MKFMLMMHAPRGTGEYEIYDWPKVAIDAHMEHMFRLNDELKAAGEMVAVHGLTPPGEARIVRGRQDDAFPVVTDGPFPEAKEFLAGFWLIRVDGPERAYEIAARASVAPGRDGRPLHMPIEVRQVMEGESADD